MSEPQIDLAMMRKLSGALSFVCGPAHAATKAMQAAVASGADKDIKAARAQFLKLKSSERQAALAMLQN